MDQQQAVKRVDPKPAGKPGGKGRGCLIALIVVGVVMALVFVVLYFAVSQVFEEHEFSETIEVDLPPAIGGGYLEVNADGVFQIRLEDLTAALTMTLSLSPESLNNSLPIKDFSILTDTPDNERIASMLARVAFEPDSGTVIARDRALAMGARLSGELFVRPRRGYGADEEQPGSDDGLPFTAIIDFGTQQLGFAPDWRIVMDSPTVFIELDSTTRSAWQGKHGPGDSLADLYTAILSQRANGFVSQLELDKRSLRPHILDKLSVLNDQIKEEIALDSPEDSEQFSLYYLQFNNVSVDNCISTDAAGKVGFGLAIDAGIREEPAERPELPDLQIRPTPCI